uniref:Uncharacterized protein n=1 Tax=Oryza glumipatula TaxID=40148 RepID=A0A0E0AX33_9ORYZ
GHAPTLRIGSNRRDHFPQFHSIPLLPPERNPSNGAQIHHPSSTSSAPRAGRPRPLPAGGSLPPTRRALRPRAAALRPASPRRRRRHRRLAAGRRRAAPELLGGAVPRDRAHHGLQEPQPPPRPHQEDHEGRRGRPHDRRRGPRRVRQGVRDVHPRAHPSRLGARRGEQAPHAPEVRHRRRHRPHRGLRLPRRHRAPRRGQGRRGRRRRRRRDPPPRRRLARHRPHGLLLCPAAVTFSYRIASSLFSDFYLWNAFLLLS